MIRCSRDCSECWNTPVTVIESGLGQVNRSHFPGQVKKLQSILKPMMLRRLKDDVEKNLAPKQETIIEVELTNIQKKYYRAILEKNFSFLTKGANQHNMPNLINTMMELRKCCNHPYLINGEWGTWGRHLDRQQSNVIKFPWNARVCILTFLQSIKLRFKEVDGSA